MFQKTIKMGLSIALGALFIMGSTHADQCCPQDNNNCCPCPCGNYDEGFFVGADFLYWKACVADLDYAVDNEFPKDISLGEKKSKFHFAEYDWTAGYRLRAGYGMCDGSNISIIWTHWCDKNTEKASFGPDSPGNEHLKPSLWAPAFGNDRAQNGRAKVDLEYQVLDVLFGQKYCITHKLNAHPHFGFRALWLEQKEKVTYDGGRDFSNFDGVIDWKSCFDGYGLHAGLGWDYDYCQGFGLYARFGGSIVAGETDDCHNESGPEGVNGSKEIENNINFKECQCIGVPGLNIGVGFNYECDWSCGHTVLCVGYEFNHWNNTPTFRRLHDGSPDASNSGAARGNILLHGLTVTLIGSF